MRAIRYLAAALLFCGVAIPFAATPAHAVPHTTCATTTDFMTLLFDPGLDGTQTPTDFKKGVHDPVVSCTGDFGGLMTIDNVTGDGSLSCALGTGITGSAKFDWDDGENSQMDITTIGPLPGSASKAIVLQGTIQSGKFDEEPVQIVVTATVSFTPQCALPGGLTEFSGTVSLTFG